MLEVVKNDGEVGEVQESAPKYDPSKRYMWTPQTEFTLIGSEFGLMLNTFRAMLELQQLIVEANHAIERALSAAVEAGFVKEAPNEPQQPEI